jgi:phage/plasmid-associated DNA primase
MTAASMEPLAEETGPTPTPTPALYAVGDTVRALDRDNIGVVIRVFDRDDGPPQYQLRFTPPGGAPYDRPQPFEECDIAPTGSIRRVCLVPVDGRQVPAALVQLEPGVDEAGKQVVISYRARLLSGEVVDEAGEPNEVDIDGPRGVHLATADRVAAEAWAAALNAERRVGGDQTTVRQLAEVIVRCLDREDAVAELDRVWPPAVVRTSPEHDAAEGILAAHGGHVVSFGGEVRAYDATSGLWELYRLHQARGGVNDVAGTYWAIRGPKGWQARPVGAADRLTTATEKHLRARTFDPEWLDGQAPGIAVANGFLSLTPDGVVLERHRPEHRATERLDIPWDPAAAPPRTLAFARFVLADNSVLARQGEVETLAQVLGSALFGRGRRLLWLNGDPGVGKDTLVGSLARELFPPGVRSNLQLENMGTRDKFMLTSLIGARLNVFSEVDRDHLPNVGQLKRILSGEQQTIDVKHQKAVRFVPQAAFIGSSNKLPTVHDSSPGFWRRVSVIQTRDHPGADAFPAQWSNRHKVERMFKARAERQGWLRILAEAAVRSVQADDRIFETERSKAALVEWRDGADPVREFVTSCCFPTGQGEGTKASALYAAFKIFLAATDGVTRMSQTTFGQRVKASGLVEAGRNSAGRFYMVGVLPWPRWPVHLTLEQRDELVGAMSNGGARLLHAVE